MREILQPFLQLAKEAFGGVFIPPFAPGHPALSILIDRAPQIVAHASDRHEHFIEMPGIA
jgi:hypothetical protein